MFKAVITLPFFKQLITVALLCLYLPLAQAEIDIKAIRVWPSQDYTRLTLESRQTIRHTLSSVENPDRLVIDLEDVKINDTLKKLADKIGGNDPYIKSARIAHYKPGVVRLVLDLKKQIKPQLFELKPIGEYGYRLVLDVYPARSPDTLTAFLKQDVPEPAVTLDEHAADNSSFANLTKPPLRNDTDPNARTLIIAIDAGHGGEDPGAHGRHGALEKDVTLAIAQSLCALIDETPNMHGVLIRDGDYFIPLIGRVAKARKARADLFVSIHADAFIRPDAHGSSVFALSEHGATSSAASWLAKKENEADLIGGVNIAVKDPYLARTLLDLSQTATINDSIRLARQVLDKLNDINDLHSGHVEQAGFAVLKSPDIPSILVETAFISNPEEEARLTDEGYQHKLANAILGGVKRYFAQNPALSKQHVAQITKKVQP
jgi:N-acetylmuramoyl-L-alanine amidase